MTTPKHPRSLSKKEKIIITSGLVSALSGAAYILYKLEERKKKQIKKILETKEQGEKNRNEKNRKWLDSLSPKSRSDEIDRRRIKNIEKTLRRIKNIDDPYERRFKFYKLQQEYSKLMKKLNKNT